MELRISNIVAGGTGCSAPDNALFTQIIERVLFYYTTIYGITTPDPFTVPSWINFFNSVCWDWNTQSQTLTPCEDSPCCRALYQVKKETVPNNDIGWGVRVVSCTIYPVVPPYVCTSPCSTHCESNSITDGTLILIPNQNCPEYCYWTIWGNTNVTSSNYIGTNVNVPLIFKTNGNEAMRIFEDGKVGIQKNSDIKSLFQVGSLFGIDNFAGMDIPEIRFNCYEFASQHKAIINGTSSIIQSNIEGSLLLAVSDIHNADAYLNFFENTRPRGIMIGNIGSGENSHASIGLGSQNYDYSRVTIQGWTNDNTSNALEIKRYGSPNIPILRVRNDGNIGINISSPTSLLTLKTTTTDNTESAFHIKNSADDNILFVRNDSKIQIGKEHILTTSAYYPDYKLSVDGTILCKELIVSVMTEDWADFVFKKDYKLMPLTELEQKIKKEGKLPDIPSAFDVEKKGVNITQVQAKLLQKVEELTLYVIDINKENQRLKEKINSLEKNISKKSKKR